MSINLSKGQSINLKKSDGGSLVSVRMGLGWDAKIIEKRGLFGGVKKVQKDIDLDASALIIGGGRVLEQVFFNNLHNVDNTVQHAGDNLTGEGDGDDESIMVHIAGLHPDVEHIVFVVTSYSGDTFGEIDNAFVRVVDAANRDQELARYTLSGSGDNTAMIMAKLDRTPAGWNFVAIGQPTYGRVSKDLEAEVLRLV